MAFYTRRQLILLLALLAAAAAGLAVRHWRAAYPELADRLEQLDREEPAQEASTPLRSRPSTAAAKLREAPGKIRSAATELPRAPIDVNRATADELAHLPGLGPVLATRIIAARETGGRFESIDDLRKVKGLGRARLERLRALLTVTE